MAGVTGTVDRAESVDLFNRAKARMPGGVNSPVRAFRAVGGEPVFLARGKGARVFDEDGTFEKHCNMSMIEFDPMEENDVATVRGLIQRHYDYTHSQLAWRLLSGWKDTVKHFIKVMPVEYRSVLAKQPLDSEAERLASV